MAELSFHPYRKTGKPMKAKARKPMRKRAKRKVGPLGNAEEARRKFRWYFCRCMMPGCSERRIMLLATHEITQGSGYREKALTEPSLHLVLCGPCHQRIHRENWKPEREIGLRLAHFPADDSISAWHRVTGRPNTALDGAEIEAWRVEFRKQLRGW